MGRVGVFDRVGAQPNATAGDEYLQPDPVSVDLSKLLAKAEFGRDAAALKGQPEAEVFGQARDLIWVEDALCLRALQQNGRLSEFQISVGQRQRRSPFRDRRTHHTLHEN